MLKSRKTLIVIWFMLAAGAVLALYPRANEIAQDRRELKLLAEWADTVGNRPRPIQPADASTAASANDSRRLDRPEWTVVDGLQLLGTLRIDKIGLEEPIVRGSDAKALKRGAGTVVEGPLPGEPGNFVLAGHRSLTFGRHFNRLAELKAGDEIVVETSAGPARYKVSTTSIVSPDDLTVLDNDGATSELTLITCHPRKNPTHRLIVKAILVNSIEKEEKPSV
ncbi:class D sortase [Cohnella faecalis]|uniref:class D sortase n=1 Tax=Cohnella faecalis TaxID=2315694 RepID=UPI0011C2311B|nr:class D sortase [Cohnella faecalis]